VIFLYFGFFLSFFFLSFFVESDMKYLDGRRNIWVTFIERAWRLGVSATPVAEIGILAIVHMALDIGFLGGTRKVLLHLRS
jgi:hypothetical protein